MSSSVRSPLLIGTSADYYTFAVYTNGTPAFSQGATVFAGANFSAVVTLAAGDTIDFWVNSSEINLAGLGAERFHQTPRFNCLAGTNSNPPPQTKRDSSDVSGSGFQRPLQSQRSLELRVGRPPLKRDVHAADQL